MHGLRLVRLLTFVGFASSCGEDVEHLPMTGPVTLFRAGHEVWDGDQPDQPADLGPTKAALSDPFVGWLWEGELGWEPARLDQTTDFACDIEPLSLDYLGDIDFVRFAHRGGTVCVTVATPLSEVPSDERDPRFGCLEGPPLWDALVYALSDDGDDVCLTGDLLTPALGPQLPRALGEQKALLLPWLAAGDYALGLAPLCGAYAEAPTCDGTTSSSTTAARCVPYALAVAIVPGQAACDALHDQLVTWLAGPVS